MTLTEKEKKEIGVWAKIYWRTVLFGFLIWIPFFEVVKAQGPLNIVIVMLSMNVAFTSILIIMCYSDYKVMKIRKGEVNYDVIDN